jgi:hypothetical protein
MQEQNSENDSMRRTLSKSDMLEIDIQQLNDRILPLGLSPHRSRGTHHWDRMPRINSSSKNINNNNSNNNNSNSNAMQASVKQRRTQSAANIMFSADESNHSVVMDMPSSDAFVQYLSPRKTPMSHRKALGDISNTGSTKKLAAIM